MTRQLILLTLLLLSTGPVYAEWVSIGTVASQGGATIARTASLSATALSNV
jgi:hypothetical protein